MSLNEPFYPKRRTEYSYWGRETFNMDYVSFSAVSEIPSQILELLVLKTVALGEPMQAYGIGQFIQATSENVLRVDTQALSRILKKMVGNGLLAVERELGSEGGRQYRITSAGRQRSLRAAAEFRMLTAAVGRVLAVRCTDAASTPVLRYVRISL